MVFWEEGKILREKNLMCLPYICYAQLCTESNYYQLSTVGPFAFSHSSYHLIIQIWHGSPSTMPALSHLNSILLSWFSICL